MAESQELEMGSLTETEKVSESARTSSEDLKPSEMLIVADSMLVSSTSVMVRDESMTVAPSPSVKVKLLLQSEYWT